MLLSFESPGMRAQALYAFLVAIIRFEHALRKFAILEVQD